MGIQTRIGTRVRTRVAGGYRSPGDADLPADLAAAIVRHFDRSALPPAIARIYRDGAGENPGEIYLIFSVQAGNPILTTSTSYWYDQRVRFTVYARDSDVANHQRERVWRAFKETSFTFGDGFSIPFFVVNRSEGKEPNRGGKNNFFFRAVLDVSARTCRED